VHKPANTSRKHPRWNEDQRPPGLNDRVTEALNHTMDTLVQEAIWELTLEREAGIIQPYREGQPIGGFKQVRVRKPTRRTYHSKTAQAESDFDALLLVRSPRIPEWMRDDINKRVRSIK